MATEYGAYGIAILLIEQLTGYTVIEQANIGSGIDYWLGHGVGDLNQPFRRAARLEVSGIRRGNIRRIEARVKQKSKQTELSADRLPAFIVVVEFGKPRAEVVQR
jgi:hypothetical protein